MVVLQDMDSVDNKETVLPKLVSKTVLPFRASHLPANPAYSPCTLESSLQRHGGDDGGGSHLQIDAGIYHALRAAKGQNHPSTSPCQHSLCKEDK